MSEARAKFEKWLMDVHGLDSNWNEERNCFDDFPAHLAFKAWQAALAVEQDPMEGDIIGYHTTFNEAGEIVSRPITSREFYAAPVAAPVQVQALREALEQLLHAVCGETGFANAVRTHTGTPYPWPALDIAEERARSALRAISGDTSK